MRKRQPRGHPKPTCSKCGKPVEPNRRQTKQRYCRTCHRDYMRARRTLPVVFIGTTENGVKYATPVNMLDACRFTLIREAHTTDKDIKEAKRILRDNNNVVGKIKVVEL